MSRIRAWLDVLLNRRRFERDLDDELAFHEEQRSRQLRAEGADHAQARRQARLGMGMAGMHRDAVRSARGLAAWDAAAQSLRLAACSLRRAPGFAGTALIVPCLPLTAGIPLYAMFSSCALQAPPMAQRDRWVYLEGVRADAGIVSDFTEQVAQALMDDPPTQAEGLLIHRPVRESPRTDGNIVAWVLRCPTTSSHSSACRR